MTPKNDQPRPPLNRDQTRALTAAGLALLLLAPARSVAEDEKQPNPKAGSCPVGYRISGNYCIKLK